MYKIRPTALSRRRRAFAVVLTTSALGLVGCTTSTGPASSDGVVDTIHSSFASDPNTFAPYDGRAVDDYAANSFLYATLVYKDDGNTFVPGLASSWDVDSQRGVFHINEDGVCGDGTPITPSVVAASLSNFADPEVKARFARDVFGPGEPTITSDDEEGTVTIELAQPWSDLLNGLSLTGAGIVCPAGLEDPEGLEAGDVPEAVSGPYTLTKKQAGVQYIFELRDEYEVWPEYETPLPGDPARRVIYGLASESSALVNELISGTTDVGVIRGKEMSRLQDAEDITNVPIPAANLFVLFNEREGHPFQDEELRIAVAKILDREAFNQATNGGFGQLSATSALPAVPCFNEDESLLYSMDEEAARGVLEGVSIQMLGSQAFGPNGAGNTYVYEQLRNVGADIELRNVDNATWTSEAQQKPDSWDITVMGWINASATMSGAIAPMIGEAIEDGGGNWSGVDHTGVSDLMTSAIEEDDDDRRCDLYREAQEELITGAHMIPLSTLASQVSMRDGFFMKTPNESRSDFTLRVVESN